MSEFRFRGIRQHLRSNAHNAKAKDDPSYQEVLQKIVKPHLDEDDSCEKESKVDKESLLSYTHPCCSLGLSIRQISLLSKELKRLEYIGRLKFFEKTNFSEQNISRIINCFGTYHKEVLEEGFSQKKSS